MTTENIDIKVREDGSRIVQRRLEDIGTTSEKSASGVDLLKRALAALGLGLAVREVLRLADTYTALQNRLRSTGLEGAALTTVYAELLRVSNATRSSVEGSIELYARLAISAKELGVSQKQLIEFTTSLNQAVTLSGASAQEAQAGIIQLSQGLASGTLRGDELRSVLEQLPAVADVIAKGLKVTRGQLRQLGEDGKITAGVVLKAFQEARGELEQRFAKTVPTLSQSFTVLKNNALDFVGRLDAATGVTAALSRLIFGLATNLELVAKVLASLLSGLVLIGGAVLVVNGLTLAFTALSAAVAANPLGAFLVVLTSVLTALFLFRDQISLGVDAVASLGDLMRALGDVAGRAFDELLGAARTALGPIGQFFADTFGGVSFTLVGFLRGVAGVVDLFTGLWRGAVGAVLQIFLGVPPAIKDLFVQALNAVLAQIGLFVNKAGELLNTVTDFAGLGKIATKVDFALDNTSAGAARNLGSDIRAAFDEGIKSSSGASDFLSSVVGGAQAFGAARAEVARLAARNPAQVSTVAGPAIKPSVDLKGLEKAQNALRSLLNTIQPSAGAVLELAKAEKTLNEAVQFGLINREKANAYLVLARQHYEDTINPLGKVNRELDEQARLLGVTAKERGVETDLLKISNDLKQQGLPLTQAETRAIREKLQAQRDLNALVQAQDGLLADSVGKREAFATQLKAIQNLLADPASGFTAGDSASAVNALAPDLFAGTQVAIDAQLESFRNLYAEIDDLRADGLINDEAAATARARIDIMANEARLAGTRSFFDTLAGLSSSGNNKLAAIGKAAAVTSATIDGVLAVQKALAAPPGWPYNAGNVVAVGVTAAANVARIAGFEQGGYTGSVGRKAIAGVVHGEEFVVHADATARNRAALEAMNAGREFSAGGGDTTVIVNNYGSGSQVTQQERETPTGKEIEITIVDVVSRQVRRGGPIADSMQATYGLNRASGAAR